MKLTFHVSPVKTKAEAPAADAAQAIPFRTSSCNPASSQARPPSRDLSSGASSPAKMAPVTHSDQKVIEDQLKDVIQDLYQIMVQVNSYDQANTSRSSKDILENSIKQLHTSLQKVHSTASNPSSNLPVVPPELLTYVDNGRNPDIYTREFVEGARRSNQLMKGKMEAFGSFRDVLAQEMARFYPELREDVGKVLDETGGRRGFVLDEDA